MNNLFGTDGIRGRVGTGWFVPEKLSHLANALALWAIQRYGPTAQILLLHDTRESCSWIKEILQNALSCHNLTVWDAHILPTPAAWHIMNALPQFDCAFIISASHNPYHDNGIKLIDRLTGKLSVHDEQSIIQLLLNQSNPLIPSSSSTTPFPQAEDYYYNALIAKLPTNLLAGIRIVLDVAHGATYRVAERIFSALGAQLILLHNNPDGRNINEQCGSTHVTNLQQTVRATGASIGFAFDGDGDRVIAVNKHGELKDGDDLLALLLDHPAYRETSCVVGTIMSNQGLVHYLATRGKKLIRTAVGDRYVAEQLIKESLLLGGEPSGHIIMRDSIATGDGILVALRIMEVIIATNNWAMITFAKYPQVIINVPSQQRKDLECPSFKQLINQATQELVNGRIVVRFSGTENCLRVMVEAHTEEQAHSIGNKLAHRLAKELSL